MPFFVSAKESAPASSYAVTVGLAYAGLITVLLVAQLFTFEEFIEIVPAALGLEASMAAGAIAPSIVVIELLALPYVLRMYLSPAFRWMSRVFGWIVPLAWLIIGLIAMPAENTGIAGGLTDVSSETTVIVSLLLAVFAAYANYHLSQKKKS